jgi:Encapsulating protein for peroxidase
MATYTTEYRAISYYNSKMIVPLRYNFTTRSLFLKQTPIPDEKDIMEYDRITDMGEATVSYELPGVSLERDEIKTAAETVRMMYLSKGWQISNKKWKAFETLNVDLPTENMKSALAVIGTKENEMLTVSYKPDNSNVRVEGLYAAADNSYSTSKDFGTAGNATDAVGGGLALIRADKVNGVNHNLVLAYDQYTELTTSRATTNGLREWNDILELLNLEGGPVPGRIINNPYLTAGTGMLTPADPDGEYIELLVGQNITNEVGRDSREPISSPMYGKTYEKIAPHIIHPDSICTLTTI